MHAFDEESIDDLMELRQNLLDSETKSRFVASARVDQVIEGLLLVSKFLKLVEHGVDVQLGAENDCSQRRRNILLWIKKSATWGIASVATVLALAEVIGMTGIHCWVLECVA